PAAMAEKVQHDLHEVRCPCGREHAAPRPAGVPGSALPVGPRLRALAVCLVVFQHVPVERCRLLITAAPVAGFDETTLRSGPAGEKKYVHGAFTGRYSAFWLGTRSLEAMEDAGILPDFA